MARGVARKAVEFLLEKGANPDRKAFGMTPAQTAGISGDAEVAQILERASARSKATRRQAKSKAGMKIEAEPSVPLMQREALARAAEDALLAELEAEEAEAAAKRKVKKEKRGKKTGKENEAAALASVTAALEGVMVGEGEGRVATDTKGANGGRKNDKRTKKSN
jgi:hypothetical protein